LPDLIARKKLAGIIMPYYMPEVMAIYEYVQEYMTVRYGQPDWGKTSPLVQRLVKEGDRLCGHIEILNPPVSPSDIFSGYGAPSEPGSIDAALNMMDNLGVDLPRDEIEEYETPLTGEGMPVEYRTSARTFVHQFFISLSHRVAQYGGGNLSFDINRHFQLAANQVSIVFACTHPSGERWLFTGDADDWVFDRLIASGKNLSAKYLKVPHHGSRENLSIATLKAVSPEVAIVSHKNRRFGRSLDPHPHHEVMDILDRQGVRTYYTNPVIKKKVTIKPGAIGSKEGGALNFV